VHLVGFTYIIRIFHDARSPERQNIQQLFTRITTDLSPSCTAQFIYFSGNICTESEIKSVSVTSALIDLPVGVEWPSLCEVCGE